MQFFAVQPGLCYLGGGSKSTEHIYPGWEGDGISALYKALPQGVCWNSQFGIQKLAVETGAASIYCGF
ncbi:hypothetical protein ERO13_A06G130504v2 [Gossypium hirsutum]|nr:hypothetical protein ERO13_A06G130504v2 [Gossypium hirsutum]